MKSYGPQQRATHKAALADPKIPEKEAKKCVFRIFAFGITLNALVVGCSSSFWQRQKPATEMKRSKNMTTAAV